MIKKVSYILIFLILVLAGLFLYWPKEKSEKKVEDILQPPVAEKSSVDSSLIQKIVTKAQVNFIVGDKKYSAAILPGQSVYEAMQILSSTTSFTFKAKYYPSLGYFIDEINGVKNTDGFYWTLYVNDTYSTVGAAQVILKDGDKVEWKYEKK